LYDSQDGAPVGVSNLPTPQALDWKIGGTETHTLATESFVM
jgi:hypothetical protein